MEMHQARYFVALCETLNFTRAAEKCNVTQPSLTRAIKLLEDELGGPLFNRERNQTHLTELGRMMEPHLREVLEQAGRRGRGPAASSRCATRGSSWGSRAGSRSRSLDDTLRRFVAAIPTPRSRCTTIARASCARRCAAAISRSCSCRSGRTTWTTCTTIRWARTGCSRSCRRRTRWPRWLVPLRQLAEHALVCGDGCPFWEAAERTFREAGLTVTPKAIATRAEWLYELVGAGVGIGVAALHARPAARPGQPPDRRRGAAHEINLTTKRGRLYSPPVKAFVDLALKPRPRPQATAA